MIPYYKDEFATIYNVDSTTEELPHADLLVMDPPFNIWSQVPKVEGKTVVAFTTWQYRKYVENLYGNPRTELIWHFKDGRWVSHTLPRVTHETILIFGPTYNSYVGELTDGITRNKGKGSVGRDTYETYFYTPRERKSINSVLVYPRTNQEIQKKAGIWTKPIEMITLLMKWTTTPTSTVLDPYMGSGTTLVAAKKLGLQSIGIEIDEKLCEVAAKRLQEI